MPKDEAYLQVHYRSLLEMSVAANGSLLESLGGLIDLLERGESLAPESLANMRTGFDLATERYGDVQASLDALIALEDL